MLTKIIIWEKGMIPEADKCYSGMPNETYHSFKDWNGSSDLKNTSRSVEYYEYKKNAEHKVTLALERGCAFHVAMQSLVTGNALDMFSEQVLECQTAGIGTKAWQSLKDENPGCYVLPEQIRKDVVEMTLKAHGKTFEIGFFDSGHAELSLFWVDSETDIQCKARPDWLTTNSGNWIIDYKSSKNHQEEEFKKDIVNFGYHFSAAQYIEGVRQVLGVDVREFVFLTIANTPPFEVECYTIGEQSLAEGYELFHKSLRKISTYNPQEKLQCKTTEIPRWGFRETIYNDY